MWIKHEHEALRRVKEGGGGGRKGGKDELGVNLYL